MIEYITKITFKMNNNDKELFNKLLNGTTDRNKSKLIREAIKTYDNVLKEAPELIISETLE